MDSTPTPGPLASPADRAFEQQLREMNEALVVSSVKQHELAEQAQKAELRYRRLFEAAQDAVLVLDAHTGRITDANPQIQQWLGYALSELAGKELWQLDMFEEKEAIRSAFQQLQLEGYLRIEDLRIKTKDGQKAEVEFISNVYQEEGNLVILCNLRDTSQCRQLERAKVEAEVSADLHRRKDEFLAMLSHEIRNPLAAIINAVDLLDLQQATESPIQRQARTIIQRQMGQLKCLVDDLLDVSRITTGRIQLRRERIFLHDVVKHAVETARPLIQERRHELTVSLPPTPILVYADAARLEQVVVNLLTNAAKYTDEGGSLWLAVQLARREPKPAEALIRMRDTGVGIAPHLLPRIFDLFTQAERSLDRSEGGLGIGLSLVQKLTELHGGTVQAYSTLGQGSEFVIRLPVMPPGPPPAAPAAESPHPTAPLRLLVVDDNVDAAESLAVLLRMAGHQVRTVHDGLAALQAARDHRPDVVLLDIGLPGLNGFEVAQHIRQQPALQNSVLIAITGYGQLSDHQRSQESGFDYHLVKPADFAQIHQILAEVPQRIKQRPSAD